MAARHGLGLARAWVLSASIARAAPIGLAFRPSCRRSLSTIPSGSRISVSAPQSTILSSLRIRHNSTQSAKTQPEEPEKTTTTPKPVDPLTAPPVVAADPPNPPAKSADTASILKLLSLAKPQWPLLTVGISCLVVSTGVNLGIPWAIGRIIDYFAPGSEATMLFGLPLEQATWALVGILLVGALANSGRAMALRLAGQRTVAGIRQASSHHMPKL